MPVQRKVFRIEENPRAMARGAASLKRAQSSPQDAYLDELRALRTLIEPRAAASRDAMERARAQLAEAEAYRRELATLYAAIEYSRPATAALNGAAPGEPQLARACRELNAVVVDTERAAQAILRAAETIDEAANALRTERDGQQVARDIGSRVAQIYEACNFQDLTGQRIANVLAALRSIEAQLARLMQAWRGIDEFKPVVFDDQAEPDRALLNGPKLAGDSDHASQDDIDAMFGCA